MTTSTHRLKKPNLYFQRIHALYDALLKASPALALAIMKKLPDSAALALLKIEFRLNVARNGEAAIRDYWLGHSYFTPERLNWFLDGTFDKRNIAAHAAGLVPGWAATETDRAGFRCLQFNS